MEPLRPRFNAGLGDEFVAYGRYLWNPVLGQWTIQGPPINIGHRTKRDASLDAMNYFPYVPEGQQIFPLIGDHVLRVAQDPDHSMVSPQFFITKFRKPRLDLPKPVRRAKRGRKGRPFA